MSNLQRCSKRVAASCESCWDALESLPLGRLASGESPCDMTIDLVSYGVRLREIDT